MELLKGKICLVTGASRGIGLATVKRFVEEGATVYANVREPRNMDAYYEELSEKNIGFIKSIYFDVRDEQALHRAFQRIKEEQGRLDVLVNNAGIMRDALIGMVSSSLMREMYETNVMGCGSALQFAARLMKKHRSGSIVNLSSIVGIEGNAGQLAYSASKGAVAAMTRTASKELAEYGIRVNAVAPGMINTDMYRSIGVEKIKAQTANIGLGRLGEPEEVADAILFLASDLSRYVTGEILGVNGGAVI